MSRRVIFVTQDHEGLHGGGAGTLVGEVARRLTGTGCEVTMVVASPDAEAATGDGYETVPVTVSEPDGSLGWFVGRSQAISDRLGQLVAETGPVDLVEFTDFEAPALWTLIHRHALGLDRTRIAIRLHGPIEAITDAIGAAPPPMDGIGAMERLALPMADAVLVPSSAVGAWAIDRYGLDPERIVVAPPAVVDVLQVGWTPSASPTFAALGRLSETKGTDLLVDAFGAVLDRHPDARLVLVGPDGWSALEHRPMTEVLRDRIPRDRADQVEFVGALLRDEALARLAGAWVVVISSRYESFCLAAHEARRAGIPVVVPDLPAFDAYRTGAGFAFFDGSAVDLANTLVEIASDRGIVERLAAEPAPAVGDPTAAYLGPLPEARHARSQAGLATAAAQRLDGLLRPASTWWSRPARSVLRALPAPVARVLVRLVPARLKDRFRAGASWPEEEARRRAERRLRDMRRRIEQGEFPDESGPTISVVIPCFDQGQWVTDAVVSVFEQEHRSWEVILVDDGSTDPDTIAILDDLARWPRVRSIRQDNRGLSSARNVGMEAARGEYLIPLDADDEITPRFMADLLGRLEANPRAAFAHCWAELFGDVHALWATRPPNPYWERCSNSVVGCVLMRREAWKAVGGYDETMRDGNEDWELWVRLAAAGWEQVRVMEPLFRYRKHGETMSVATESQFERGRAQIVERHPDLYTAEALRSLKQRWYPALTLISDAAVDESHDEVEVVPGPPDRGVAASFGKYVADRRGATWPLSVAMDLVRRLEAEPDAAWATHSATGAAVWRRWCLVDPGADPRGGVRGTGAAPGGDLQPGAYPDPEWMVDRALVPEGARLLRHRPEEDALTPEG
ncbi:MAG: glycosyltransferase [Acidimicrobiia bacterium]